MLIFDVGNADTSAPPSAGKPVRRMQDASEQATQSRHSKTSVLRCGCSEEAGDTLGVEFIARRVFLGEVPETLRRERPPPSSPR